MNQGIDYDRQPAHDDDAERGVLGGMLMSAAAVEEVAPLLKAGKFYQPKHGQIFDAIMEVYQAHGQVGAVAVADELRARKQLGRVGGPPYLHDLMEAAPHGGSAGYFAEIVADAATLRGITDFAVRSWQMSMSTDRSDISEIVSRIQTDAFALTPQRDTGDSSTLAAAAERVADSLEKPTTVGVMTGFKDLDTLTGGLKPGRLTLIAARPGGGKSTIGVDALRNVSIKDGLHSALFSLEMGIDEITTRIFAAEGKINMHHLEYDRMTEDDWSRFAKHYGDIVSAPMHIDDTENQTINEICAKTRALAHRHPLRLLVVDYLQLVAPSSKHATREREVTEAVVGLKNLAKELQIHVIALAQLNRDVEKRTDKKPVASDMRESGSLEATADIVILLHREDMYEENSPRAGEADLIVAKHRGGPKATITVAFQGHYSRFVDLASQWTPHAAAEGAR